MQKKLSRQNEDYKN